MRIFNIEDIKPGYYLAYMEDGTRYFAKLTKTDPAGANVGWYYIGYRDGYFKDFESYIGNILDDVWQDEVYETFEEIKLKYMEDFL